MDKKLDKHLGSVFIYIKRTIKAEYKSAKIVRDHFKVSVLFFKKLLAKNLTL